MNRVNINQRGAMDTEKPAWIETVFKFGDSLIDGMAMTINHGVSELVVRDEVCHDVEI